MSSVSETSFEKTVFVERCSRNCTIGKMKKSAVKREIVVNLGGRKIFCVICDVGRLSSNSNLSVKRSME